MAIGVGERAPDFTLPASNGESVTLSVAVGTGVVVLFFYPKDDSPGCTIEACGFRDRYDAFVEAGATVLGISADSLASHRQFASNHGLPMTLLSDPDGKVRRLYGVQASLGLFPGRATFVIDREGIVRRAFVSQLRFRKHVQEALDEVRRLRGMSA